MRSNDGGDDSGRVHDYFSRSAELFDSLYADGKSNPIMRLINRVFRRDMYIRYLWTLEHIHRTGAESALDVGCGSGRYLRAMADANVRRLVGVDCSARMLELAEAHTATAPDSVRIDLICCDFSQFETSERFDVIVAMGLFDYVADPVPVLIKMRSLARHSVIASFPSISLYRTPIRQARYWLKDCPVYFYRRNRIAALGASAGYSTCEVRKIRGSGQDYVATFIP
ncbi:class I SAM-dependent methyltransferase [Candidatus Poribacteria bacterium]|nr:class I SAM-dependent methyltransferase [Candidatus Poribacteria bacterium]